MHKDTTARDRCVLPVSRRRFVQGLAAGGAMAALDRGAWASFGETNQPALATLSGKHFELTIDSLPVNFTGRRSVATAVNGSLPGPVLRWREGDTVTIAVTNRLKVPASIHWHSVRLPADMDGVPGLSFPGIAPGETFHYRFPVVQNGTAWCHSHSRFQGQTGLSGPIVIDPRGKDPVDFDREYVVFLSDWTDTDPETLYSNLKQQSDYYQYHRLTLPEFISEAKRNGLGRTISDRLMWAKMNMSPTDILDITGATYTYLLNGNSPNANWTGLFRRGERIRLRFINGSSMSIFDVRIPGLKMTVVQADGNDVEPVVVDEFRIATAETYDVIVQPQDDAAYTIFAQSENRSGYARGTLAPRIGTTAAVPPMDPVPMRTMKDMGMDMGRSGTKTGDMAGRGMGGVTKEDMPASSNGAAGTPDMPKMRMHSVPGMEMGNGAGMIPLPQPGPDTMPVGAFSAIAIKNVEAHLRPFHPVHLHPGPQVDNVAMQVSERLNDPGIALKGNGRRVLTYADLRARYRGVDGRLPTREVELHLTGNMERFIWGFDGRKFSSAEPIVLRLGERVRIVLINDTMMDHPIHLHGLWSELENGQGAFNPYKHTVNVKPAERLSYLVSADTPGRWAYHCHLLYHMEAGMFRTVMVAR